MKPDEAADVAHRIATRICRSAIWSANTCAWRTLVPDLTSPVGEYRSREEVAGPGIYSGTAGIALFLATAYRQTGDASLIDVARGALAHARAQLRPGREFSYYTGHVGVAYAHATIATLIDEPRYPEIATAILKSTGLLAPDDPGGDVMSGAAGSIPRLLQLGERPGAELATAIAIRLGDRLIRSARRGPSGWSWGAQRDSARDLTGYAHGASGMAHALAELSAVTGDGRYRYAAEQAVAYERWWYDAAHENWPDFRHTKLSEFHIYSGSMSATERTAAISAIEPYQPHYMSAWCHGASGIGLSRLRLLELFADPLYAEEAAAAVRTIQRSLTNDAWQRSSFALCHGVTSDCETLLLAARLLGDANAGATAADIASRASAMFEDRGIAWRSGVLRGAPDPTLMLGDAGIGYFYLRLASSDVPSVILPTTSHRGASTTNDAPVEQLRREYVDQYFGQTLQIFARALDDGPQFVTEHRAPIGEAEPRVISEAIAARIAQTSDSDVAAKLADAFARERVRYELACRLPPRCDVALAAMRPRTEPSIEVATIALTSGAEVVVNRWDWPRWLASESCSLVDVPAFEGHGAALWQETESVRCEDLSVLAALVLRFLGEVPRATLPDIFAATRKSLDGPEFASAAIRSAVTEQLVSLQRAGLVEIRATTY